jgi:ferredoxin
VSAALYYVSGTGNSLHVARELQRRLSGSELVPIVRLLGQDTIRTEAETVGLVFPNFCTTIPISVHHFLRKVDLRSAQYLFAVCTRGGSPSEAFDYINALLKGQGKGLDAQLNVTMPWNLPLGKENLPGTSTAERVQQLESEMQSKLDPFARIVLAREAHVRPDTDATFELPQWSSTMTSLIPKSLNYELHRFMYQDLVHFYADSACNGCGICAKACLSHKVELVDERPVWNDEAKCYACFACINYCPQQAIQIQSRFPIRSYTHVTARYHHPMVSYRDIAQQRPAKE